MDETAAVSPGVGGVPQRQHSVDRAKTAIGEACDTPMPLSNVSCTVTDTDTCDEPPAAPPAPHLEAVLPAEALEPPGPVPADAGDVANGDIDLCRRAVLLQPQEADVCSICLDEFTEEDPGQRTKCGHLYHLQCVMQWAQRSRECPLCFKALGLDNPDLNDLLPFGEYTAPPGPGHNPNSFAQQIYGVEPWELERLLQRLAIASQQGSGQGSSGSRRRHRHRHREEEGEQSAQRHRNENRAEGGRTSERRHTHSLPAMPAGHLPRNSTGGAAAAAAEGRYPRASTNRGGTTGARRASFNAPGQGRDGTSSSSSAGEVPSTFDLKSASGMLRSRLMAASTKCKEMGNGVRSLWRSATSSNPQGAGPSNSRS